MSKTGQLSILFVADIVGQPGIEITTKMLPMLRDKHRIDLCIVNGENCSNGKGLTQKISRQLFALGVDVITSGNHIWYNKDIFDALKEDHRILRPHNYPENNYGSGATVVETRDGVKVAVLNLQGRTFMYSIDCPFRRGMTEVKRLQKEARIIVVDFHAEATAEKIAMGWYLDGKVSAVLGTHTHVPTADERILPEGTAYITDVGMTGPFDSVLGLKKEVAINRFIHQTPQRYKVAESDLRLCGVIVEVEKETGRATSIQRISVP